MRKTLTWVVLASAPLMLVAGCNKTATAPAATDTATVDAVETATEPAPVDATEAAPEAAMTADISTAGAVDDDTHHNGDTRF